MNIALMAHDAKKELLVELCIAYSGLLGKHRLFATGTTGRVLIDATDLHIQKFLSGHQGGSQQIAARVACNEIDILLFFRDPMMTQRNSDTENDNNLLKLCDKQNIPVATNMATAEALIHSLERGDLEWRNILNAHI